MVLSDGPRAEELLEVCLPVVCRRSSIQILGFRNYLRCMYLQFCRESSWRKSSKTDQELLQVHLQMLAEARAVKEGWGTATSANFAVVRRSWSSQRGWGTASSGFAIVSRSWSIQRGLRNYLKKCIWIVSRGCWSIQSGLRNYLKKCIQIVSRRGSIQRGLLKELPHKNVFEIVSRRSIQSRDEELPHKMSLQLLAESGAFKDVMELLKVHFEIVSRGCWRI